VPLTRSLIIYYSYLLTGNAYITKKAIMTDSFFIM